MNRQNLYKYLSILVITIIFTGCLGTSVHTDPGEKDIYEKEKLLMTEEELDLFQHLPDKTAKDEYISEFWARRDPTPSTEENEFKEEFNKRIEYANRWFYEFGPRDRGWNTDRGRILLIFGMPDMRDTQEVYTSRSEPPVNMERWYYERYRLYLYFIADIGANVYRLRNPGVEMMEAIRMEKLNMGGSEKTSNIFRFKAQYKNNQFLISIPLKNLTVEETKNQINIRFKVRITVFLNYTKVENIEFAKDYSFSQEKIQTQNDIQIQYPYSPKEKGTYLFDLVVENLISGERYRDYFKARIK